MARNDLQKVRLEKLEKIRKSGLNPYPAKTTFTHTCMEAILNYDSLQNKEITLCGRIRLIRGHGKISFADLVDESSKIQISLKQDLVGQETYDLWENIDIGDFVEVSGKLFTTKTKEKTLNTSRLKILSKSIRPLPEKWHGLSDVEQRLRKRYLDLIMNPKTREVFKKKAEFIDATRDFMTDRGFLEVQTPVLQPVAGGAAAKPFITHHNVLDIDLYLRIAPELYLKRLIVGGFEKVFELGPVFRNEGMSREHLQEFIAMEFYWAYKNYEDLMKFSEEMMAYILPRVFGTMKFKFEKYELDFMPPWPRIDFRELILKETGVNLNEFKDRDALAEKLYQLDIKYEKGAGYGRLIDILYKQKCRPKLISPCFLINHPLALSPLAKKSDKDPDTVERFQIIAAGMELANAYSELNDPVDQKKRFLEEAKLRRAGDEEAHMMDEDFIEALEYGMPPTAGFGMGIDRMIVLLMNLDSVREAVFFPQMREKPKVNAENTKKNVK